MTTQEIVALIVKINNSLAKIAEYKRLTITEEYNIGQWLRELHKEGAYTWTSQKEFFQQNFPNASHNSLYAYMRLANEYKSVEEVVPFGEMRIALHAPKVEERRQAQERMGKKAMDQRTLDVELHTLDNLEDTYVRKVEELGKEVVLNGTFKQQVERATRLKRVSAVARRLLLDLETCTRKEPA